MFASKSKESTRTGLGVCGQKGYTCAKGYRDEPAHEKCGPDEFQVPSRSKTLIPVYPDELNRKFHGGSSV